MRDDAHAHAADDAADASFSESDSGFLDDATAKPVPSPLSWLCGAEAHDALAGRIDRSLGDRWIGAWRFDQLSDQLSLHSHLAARPDAAALVAFPPPPEEPLELGVESPLMHLDRVLAAAAGPPALSLGPAHAQAPSTALTAARAHPAANVSSLAPAERSQSQFPFHLKSSAVRELSGVSSTFLAASSLPSPSFVPSNTAQPAKAAPSAASTPSAPASAPRPASTPQCSWHAQTGKLFVSVDHTKVWDVEYQLPVRDLPLFPLAPAARRGPAHAGTAYSYIGLSGEPLPLATALAVCPRGDLVIAGLANGYVSVVDSRIPSAHALVSCYSNHTDAVAHVAVHAQHEQHGFSLVSVSRAGVVNLVDSRAFTGSALPHDLAHLAAPPSLPADPEDAAGDAAHDDDDCWYDDFLLESQGSLNEQAPPPEPEPEPEQAFTPITSFYRKTHTVAPPVRTHAPTVLARSASAAPAFPAEPVAAPWAADDPDRDRDGDDDAAGGASGTGVSAAAVHPVTGWVATGSQASFVDIFQLRGDSIQTVKYHASFVSQRIGPVHALAFHPLKPVLAMATDAYVALYVANKFPWHTQGAA
jgi:hypothetical protein